MARRDRKEIYAAIISALDREVRRGDRSDVRLTWVQTQANVPFDRLKEYLAELEHRGLVRHEGQHWEPTREGLEFVQEFNRFQRMLERFGFE